MKTECPRCKEKLEIDNANAGLKVTCPTCQHEFQCPEVKTNQPKKEVSAPNVTEKKLKEITKILYVGLIAFPLFGGSLSFLSIIPKTYQYTITTTPDLELNEKLDFMGENGWEMVSARRASIDDNMTMAYEIIWKRPK